MKTRLHRGFSSIALAGAVVLLVPVPAAASIQVTSDATASVRLTDITGVADVVTLSGGGGTAFHFVSTQVLSRAASANSICSAPTQVGSTFVIDCLASAPRIIAFLAAGNDDWNDQRLTNVLTPTEVNGGLGNDEIDAGAGADLLRGDDGADTIFAEGGADVIEGGIGNDQLESTPFVPAAGTGADTINGGDGDDDLGLVDGDTANGGNGNDDFIDNEGDDLNTIAGGAGTDTHDLRTPDTGVNIIEGFNKTEVFTPRDNFNEKTDNVTDVETFLGGVGPDVFNGGGGTALARTYDGRSGTDVVVGTPGADTVIGGNGPDIILGGSGNDSLDAKGGETAAVPDIALNCGADTDTASIDLLDPEPTGCETVNRSAIGERGHVRIKAPRVARRRAAAGRPRLSAAQRARTTVAVKLRCPARVRHACRGALRLGFRKRGIGRARATRYRVPAGKSRTVAIKLSGRRARLARRGKKIYLRSLEQGDVRGLKTTTTQKFLR